MLDKDFHDKSTRENQLRDFFQLREFNPKCNEEYLKIPIDLPWDALQKDIPLAFEKFGWYGMVHRAKSDWSRSELYGGLGLNYNPDYKFPIDPHAQGLGQPRAVEGKFNKEDWAKSLDENDYSSMDGETSLPRGLNTYDDCLGLRTPTEVCSFRSISSIFDKIKMPTFQGRIAEVRAEEIGSKVTEDMKEFIWHTDERNEIISRILIPVIYDEDYWIEFKDTGTRIDFEPGYAYHFNTYRTHRWNFNYHKNIKNRTCIVLGFSPWLQYNDGEWTTNKYCNTMHPMDMVKEGLVV